METNNNLMFQLTGTIFAASLLLTVAASVSAQTTTLAPPSRTVYKCVVDKKIVYTDEPCVGAQLINVEPTRGLNKSTGRELTGKDVAREKHREGLAEAVRPITGMNPAQMEMHRRRFNLSPDAKSECVRLDTGIAHAEAQERAATTETRAAVQRDLFAFRKRHRELRC